MKLNCIRIILLLYMCIFSDAFAAYTMYTPINENYWEESLSKINVPTAPLGKYNIQQVSSNQYNGNLGGMRLSFTTNDTKITYIECNFPSYDMHVHRRKVVDLASILMPSKVKSSQKLLSRLQNRLYKLKKNGDNDSINVDGLRINMSFSNEIITVTIN